MARTAVKLNLRKMLGIQKSLRHTSPQMRTFYKKAAVRYLTFSRRRFDSLSKGGAYDGQRWEPLSEYTKAHRRKPRKGFKGERKFAILVDTGVLKRSMLVGGPGNQIVLTNEGIKVGIGGGAKHNADGPTIGEIAEVHQFGEGRVPARPIFTDKIDESTRKGLQNDLRVAIKGIK